MSRPKAEAQTLAAQLPAQYYFDAIHVSILTCSLWFSENSRIITLQEVFVPISDYLI